MAKLKVTGKPLAVRRANVQGKTIICVDLVEGGTSQSPKGLPAASRVGVTALLNSKQWSKLSYQEGDRLLISGELTLGAPPSVIQGELGLIALQVQKING